MAGKGTEVEMKMQFSLCRPLRLDQLLRRTETEKKFAV